MSNSLLRALVDLRDRQIQKSRIQFSNRLSAIDRQTDETDGKQREVISCWLDVFNTLEKTIDKDIGLIVKGEPIYEEMSQIRGIGPMLAAKIIAMVDIEVADSVSALWRYCFPPGTMVMTDSGAKPIETLTVLDQVYGKDGKLHHIEKLMNREYIGKLVRIKAKKMLPFSCTPNHPILTVSVDNRKYKRRILPDTEVWKSSDELKVGDWVVIPRIRKEAPADPAEIDNDTSYLYGRFVGDGSTSIYQEGKNERGYTVITFGAHETEGLDKIEPIARQFGATSATRQGSALQLRIGRTQVTRNFRRLFGSHAHLKRIPSMVFDSTDVNISSFMRGYLDSDGCKVSKENGKRDQAYIANTCSIGLALQLQLLGTRLGFLSSLFYQNVAGPISIEGREYNRKDRWQIAISGGDIPMLFDEPNQGNRRVAHYVASSDYFAVQITHIDYEDYDGQVYDLTCEGHTFLVNNIVVHNSGYGVSKYWVDEDGKVQAPQVGMKWLKTSEVSDQVIIREAEEKVLVRIVVIPEEGWILTEMRDKSLEGWLLPYNKRLKTTLYLVASSFLKCGSPYRLFFDNAKLHYAVTHPEWKPAHVRDASMRKMTKMFLSHCWLRWRMLEGLPTRQPYVFEKLEGHTTYYAPEDFGWGKAEIKE